MKTKFLALLSILMVLTFVFAVPGFAEGNNTATNHLDVSPVEPGTVSKGFEKMGEDLAGVGQSLAYPLFIIGMIIGVVLMVLGVFSTKLLGAGAISFVASFVALVILGDLTKVTNIITYIAETFRNYF
jgi:ABC-type transporter Mla maintaining outer membrane lipid asymmetry permease subunit MlaE